VRIIEDMISLRETKTRRRTLLNQPQTPPPHLRGGINARRERE
jgi:hypothetical protein